MTAESPLLDAARVAEWRARLADGREELRRRFLADGRTPRLLASHCRLVDDLLRGIWRLAMADSGAALVAVGGYGRGHLFPASDVDLLILLDAEPDEATRHTLETMIGALWDVGLAIGHSVRTLGECADEAARDVTVQTNLLEARLLDGSRALFERMREQLRERLRPREFMNAKVLEQQQRHLRFHDVAYNLEPNLKESPGGLRDLHTIQWIARAAGIGGNWRDLVAAGVMTDAQAREAARCERFVSQLRVRIHYLAGRREDRVIFDLQKELAAQLRHRDSPRRLASEALMQRYYRTAKTISLINEIVVKNLRERLTDSKAGELPEIIDDNFQMRRNLLEIRRADVFERQPSTLLECFVLLQRYPHLEGFSAPTLQALWRAQGAIDAAFRRAPRNRQLFMDILRQKRRITRTLRMLARYGVLARYIPAFARITGRMQHDLYHVYTVDEHTLFVLRNIRRFAVPELSHEYPLCSSLMGEFERPEVLYVAGLFHDIAKGRGGDHSLLGMADARRFCRQHALSEEDAELVAWLVRHHLTMSSTAQKQDIFDPDVIAHFAQLVENPRRLAALYLLTVADIRGTSPKVWNTWKGKLLEDLYRMTLRRLNGEMAAPSQMLRAKQIEALSLLARQAVPPGVQREFWDQLDEAYFLRHDAREIAWHTRVLNRFVNAADPVVRARLDPAHEGILVLVYLPDRPEIFARICATFERLRFTIVDAKVDTTRHGYAIISFTVLDENGRMDGSREQMSYLEYELKQSLTAAQMPPEPVCGRVSRHLRHFPITPTVNVSPDEKGTLHVISLVAGDRPGLLSRISRVFVRYGVNLHFARITTLGERAEDVFIVSEPQGRLKDEKAVVEFRKDLLATLE